MMMRFFDRPSAGGKSTLVDLQKFTIPRRLFSTSNTDVSIDVSVCFNLLVGIGRHVRAEHCLIQFTVQPTNVNLSGW